MGDPVGKVAGFAGVTVRTLHHYDEIGLLSPSGRSSAGYRSYSDADLDRLQRILFYRELGFSLDAIATIVDDPGTDAQAHLKRQRELLTGRIEQLNRMVAAVERAMEANTMGNALTPEETFEVFGGLPGRRGTPSRRSGDGGQRPSGKRGRPRWPRCRNRTGSTATPRARSGCAG
jgi:DNA-binding transcriptional MerR regulator